MTDRPETIAAPVEGRFYSFRDRDHMAAKNYDSGLEYCASGVVVSVHLDGAAPSRSGMDLCVLYMTPLGEVENAWRGLSDVVLLEISRDDYEYLVQVLEAEIES